MKLRSLFVVVGSVWLISACGARTSDDELLGYQGGVQPSSGGRSGSGGDADGGSGGGMPITGGTGGSGGSPVGGGGTPFGSGGSPLGSGGIFGTGGVFPGNTCCEEHPYPGCNVAFIEECTCDIDDFCCNNEWDRRCVNTANNACFGACFSMGGSPSSGGSPGSGGVPGVGGLPGVGGGPSSGGSSSGGAPGGNCCAPHASPSCQNMAISSCVCSFDSFCCDNSWDNYCVEGAVEYCKASCGDGSGGTMGDGGAVGAGGSGPTCHFTGECGGCMCDQCPAAMTSCQQDEGCLAIAWCIQGSACLPFDCYRPEFCRDVIDQAGGLTGPSVQLALNLSSCAYNAGCSCQ